MSRKIYDELHPEFPEKVWVVIEQPPNEPKRIAYLPERHEFVRTKIDSLAYVMGFSGAYGWIAGTGTPPGVHFDALVITEKDLSPGDVVEAVVAGVFLMQSGDHKFVTIDLQSRVARGDAEWSRLPPANRAELEGMYPDIREGEGWYGSEEARHHLLNFAPTHD